MVEFILPITYAVKRYVSKHLLGKFLLSQKEKCVEEGDDKD